MGSCVTKGQSKIEVNYKGKKSKKTTNCSQHTTQESYFRDVKPQIMIHQCSPTFPEISVNEKDNHNTMTENIQDNQNNQYQADKKNTQNVILHTFGNCDNENDKSEIQEIQQENESFQDNKLILQQQMVDNMTTSTKNKMFDQEDSPYLKQSLQYQPYNSFFWSKKKPQSADQVPTEANIQADQNINITNTTTNVQDIKIDNVQSQTPVMENANLEQNLSAAKEAAIDSGIHLKIDNPSYFNNTYIPEMDLGNVAQSLGPLNDFQQPDILTKFSYVSPGYLYEQLDVMTRDILFYIADPEGYGLGLGLSIALCSLGIKLVFMPLMTFTQLNAAKMKLIEPEMKLFQTKTQNFQKRGDYQGLREEQKRFAELRKRYGINNWVTALSLTQIPILITWFLSLRYVTSMPDKFPQLKSEGLLWFQDLSEADPYFILPLISATLSYKNISMNPNLNSTVGGSVFTKYMRYMKYLPFASLPIVAFFPSGLNVYWAITAATHLMVAVLVRSTFMRTHVFKIPEYLPGSILEKQNQKYVQQVIKVSIVDDNDSKKQMAEKMAMGLTGKPLPKTATTSTQSKSNNQATQTNTSASTSAPQDGGVKVFTNKPPKKKKN